MITTWALSNDKAYDLVLAFDILLCFRHFVSIKGLFKDKSSLVDVEFNSNGICISFVCSLSLMLLLFLLTYYSEVLNLGPREATFSSPSSLCFFSFPFLCFPLFSSCLSFYLFSKNNYDSFPVTWEYCILLPTFRFSPYLNGSWKFCNVFKTCKYCKSSFFAICAFGIHLMLSS